MYLDPGFGSILIQTVIASIAAVAVGFGIFRQRIIAFFTRKKTEEITDDASGDDDGENPDIIDNDGTGEESDVK